MSVDPGAAAYQKFQTIACCALGALMGLLIAVPIVVPLLSNPFAQLAVLLLFTVIGFRIGYRRRGSRGFLYFALVGVLILAGIVSESVEYPGGDSV